MTGGHPRRATLRDVAARAGVSTGTVSNVLTGRQAVSAAKRRDVEAAIAALGYRPDPSARALISRRVRPRPKHPAGVPRLLCVGYLCADYVARVETAPPAGARMTASSIEKTLGGRAANVAATAAGLGGSLEVGVSLLSVIGDDVDSDWAVAVLASRRVDVAPASRVAGARLSRAIVLTEHAGDRAIVNETLRVPAHALAAALADEEATPLTAGRALFVQGDQVEALSPTVREARTRGWRTALQLGPTDAPARDPKALADLVGAFDVIFINREAARGASGVAGDAVAATARALAPVAPLAVLTLDADGAAAARGGAVIARASAPPVRVVDETGAGDAFAGCFLASWLRGVAVESALRCAVLGGSLAVRTHGAQEHGLTAAKILLETYKIEALA